MGETLLPVTDKPVEVSVRHGLRTLSERLNRSRKSAPMMGWGTSAKMKMWGKERRRPRWTLSLRWPYGLMLVRLTAWSVIPLRDYGG